MRAAFLGPRGTFSEEALLASAPPGTDDVPYPTVYETVMAVQEGEVDCAIVPIENSLEGSVTATLDALAGEARDVRISGEVVRPVTHNLIASRPMPLTAVERVLSHPQASAQCERFLRERMAGAVRASAPSTAEAVRLVSASDEPWAALGSNLAAQLYGCHLLAEGVEDRSDNRTRFVWLARAGEAAPARGGPYKTSVVFWGFNDESPGALVDVLREFADRAVNLTKIESRPRRLGLGHYMFFVDLEGAADQEPVSAALEALAHRVEAIRLLGSYPAADPG